MIKIYVKVKDDEGRKKSKSGNLFYKRNKIDKLLVTLIKWKSRRIEISCYLE